MIARALAADADVFVLRLAGVDGHGEHGLDGGVAFVEVFGEDF